jgi:hypothetical protein
LYPIQLISKRLLINTNPGIHFVPEPSSLVLLALGFLGVSVYRWRRCRS